ncbi:MAG: hypothetical protein IT355_08190 [Gemmatimonadaceae bacterium]|nr:hypothetical protein [Gemmatimonadaceae bacterium]
MLRRSLPVAFVLITALFVPRPVPAQPPAEIRLRLTRDTVLSGVTCGPTGRSYAVLFADGALNECPIARDSVIAGHALPRETWILLDRSRTLVSAWLARDTELQAIPCKGKGYKTWHTRFHRDGQLAGCFLSRDATLDGVPCRAAAFLTELSGSTQVALHPGGRLQSCRVARAVTRDGVTIARGERITLSATGAVVRGAVARGSAAPR